MDTSTHISVTNARVLKSGAILCANDGNMNDYLFPSSMIDPIIGELRALGLSDTNDVIRSYLLVTRGGTYDANS